MKTRFFFKTAAFLFFLALFAANSAAQKFPEPRQEKLLNGLKVLIWNAPADEKVTVKLRIHNGAAFDPKDKMGTMALLADILFPTEQARAYFAEDLEGSLDVASNYDYIQITATGKSGEIQAILETLAAAVTNPPITQENFASVRNARLEKIKELEKNPAYIADRAIAKKLFGDFPYGRSADGTSESLMKIDRADLLFARDRFFTADNATLAVTGNVKPDFVYMAARQLFGAWKKAENKIPATFRQPDAPDTKDFSIELPNAEKYSSRSAMSVAARNDKDFYATRILTKIWQRQFCLNDEEHFGKSQYQPHLLKGVYIVGTNVIYTDRIQELPIYSGPCMRMILQKDGKTVNYPPFSQSDFEVAKAAVIFDIQQKAQTDLSDLWLDVDTFKLDSVKDEMTKLNNVTFADVQRVAENLKNQPMVRVVVKKPETAKQ